MPKKTSQEQEKDIVQATKSYKKGNHSSFQDAAIAHDIKPTTFRNWYHGLCSSRNVANEKNQLLTPIGEKSLVKWCERLDDWGFPARLDMLKSMALKIAQSQNSEIQMIGKNWHLRFLKRHPRLKAKYGTRLDRQRAYASDPKIIEDHFRKLKQLIDQHQFKPINIFNMDEKGFEMGKSKRATVIVQRGRKNPRVTQDGNREMVTVLETISAEGKVLAPMVVYKGASHTMSMHQGVTGQVEGEWGCAAFATSPNGWTDRELAQFYIENHFEKITHTPEPCLLIFDDHNSHLTSEFCQFCLNRQIHLFCLPTHSTHLLQPLDVGLFSPYNLHMDARLMISFGPIISESRRVHFSPSLEKLEMKHTQNPIFKKHSRLVELYQLMLEL